MPRIHLLLGPVGAGKSTYARRLSAERGALFLNLDAWMARLFRPDRPASDVVPWYVERAARCLDQIWQVTRGALAAGVDVVLEVGLVRRADRQAFWQRIEAAGVEVTVYLLDAPRAVRRARVERRNREQGATFEMVVPPAVFEMASDLWQPLDADESMRLTALGVDVHAVDASTTPHF